MTFSPLPDVTLSCEHTASKATKVRIEWKKVEASRVSFVYFDNKFVGKRGHIYIYLCVYVFNNYLMTCFVHVNGPMKKPQDESVRGYRLQCKQTFW